MKKINFKEFPMFKNISKTDVHFFDIRNQLSELIFQRGDGIAAHSLCHLIYESDGEVTLDERQADYLIQFSEAYCTPALIESLKHVLK